MAVLSWLCGAACAELLVQKIVTSGNWLQFLEIPIKISEHFTEKSAVSVNVQQHFEKMIKNLQKLPTSENFEM